MEKFTDFIPQNVATVAAEKIGVYNASGVKLCQIELGNLALPSNKGNKLYSFGALSDVHISQETAEEDFRRAMSFFQDTEKVDFVCIAGDLTQYNEDAEWAQYAACVDNYSVPVYPIGGNHDAYGSGLTDARFQQYTGHGTFYIFTQGNDVFIMLSSGAWPSKSGGVQPFYTAGLQALYEALETNRNKRCFVFQHYFPWGHAGDPMELYGSNSAFWGSQGQVIYSMMEHYKNSLWFHGHSHHMFECQSIHEKSNYDFDFGCHDIHIPSCALPVQVSASGTRTQLVEGSQGYVVDVYENGIHLRGRDFVKGEFLPIASYWLNTTLQTIEAGTYTDSTGTITT